MGEAEVKEEHLDQVPVLLVVEVVDEEDFQFLYLLQPLAQFNYDEQSEINGDFEVRKQVQYQDQHADKVYWEVVFQIIAPDLS